MTHVAREAADSQPDRLRTGGLPGGPAAGLRNSEVTRCYFFKPRICGRLLQRPRESHNPHSWVPGPHRLTLCH